MLNFYFLFLNFYLKNQIRENSVKDKNSGEEPKLTINVICFLLSCILVIILYEKCPD